MNKKNHKKSKNHWTMTIWTNLVETYPRHIPTKFEVDLANGFSEEVKNVNCGRRRTLKKAQLTDKSAELKMWVNFQNLRDKQETEC